jgi:hypothetical protein
MPVAFVDIWGSYLFKASGHKTPPAKVIKPEIRFCRCHPVAFLEKYLHLADFE